MTANEMHKKRIILDNQMKWSKSVSDGFRLEESGPRPGDICISSYSVCHESEIASLAKSVLQSSKRVKSKNPAMDRSDNNPRL